MGFYSYEYGEFNCAIVQDEDESILFINGKEVLRSSGPDRLVEFLRRGKTGCPEWDSGGERLIPSINEWRRG